MPSPFVPSVTACRMNTLLVASTAILGSVVAMGATAISLEAQAAVRDAGTASGLATLDPGPSRPSVATFPGRPAPVPAEESSDLARDRGDAARRDVADAGSELPGTVVLDTCRRVLLLAEPCGRAIGHGVAAGRRDRIWTGRVAMFRTHGTHDAGSVGHRASSGCTRMLSRDVVDLFGRVAVGTLVVAEGAREPLSATAD